MEEWRPIVGPKDRRYEKTYRVSSEGRIASLKSPISQRLSIKRTRVGVRGYYKVNLCLNGRKYTEFVHRLVALTFLGPPPFPGATVDHLNRNALDNRVENLRWADRHKQWENSERNSQSYLEKLYKRRDRVNLEIAELECLRSVQQ
jgi:hypothetical protein